MKVEIDDIKIINLVEMEIEKNYKKYKSLLAENSAYQRRLTSMCHLLTSELKKHIRIAPFDSSVIASSLNTVKSIRGNYNEEPEDLQLKQEVELLEEDVKNHAVKLIHRWKGVGKDLTEMISNKSVEANLDRFEIPSHLEEIKRNQEAVHFTETQLESLICVLKAYKEREIKEVVQDSLEEKLTMTEINSLLSQLLVNR